MKSNKINIPICLECIYYNKKDYRKLSCKLYPNGIPIKIIEGEKICRKVKSSKRSKKSIRERQKDDLCITVIRDGKVIIQNGKLVKDKGSK